MKTKHSMSRRSFLAASSAVVAGSALNPVSNLLAAAPVRKGGSTSPAAVGKLKLAMVGTGGRGTGMWGNGLMKRYADKIEFVGLCDKNRGRVEVAREIIGIGDSCKIYSDLNSPMSAFEKMAGETKPDMLIVTTTDSTHDEYIVRGMELGMNVLTEKPMTTDEHKIQHILDAEKRTGRKTRVTFNYRYAPHNAGIWEVLRAGEIGEITSVDFHWYLDIHHGADYFRRWHRLVENSGSLWVHKASHHFDLLNWWLESDPESVYALGSLDFYGKNGKFRADNCRECPHTRECPFYFRIVNPTLSAAMQDAAGGETVIPVEKLYVNCEKYDGYKRDGCVFRNDINIFDKMAAAIKYANGVQVSYSLTAYSPYEGYRVAFNGTKGRLDAWIQESNPTQDRDYFELILSGNFSRRRYIQVPHDTTGHGGGDDRLRDQIFIPGTPDPYRQCAGTRDGALACLVGIAARNSITSGMPVNIGDLTSLKPQAEKIYQRDILSM
jgi:predicted dehydrogenase